MSMNCLVEKGHGHYLVHFLKSEVFPAHLGSITYPCDLCVPVIGGNRNLAFISSPQIIGCKTRYKSKDNTRWNIVCQELLMVLVNAACYISVWLTIIFLRYERLLWVYRAFFIAWLVYWGLSHIAPLDFNEKYMTKFLWFARYLLQMLGKTKLLFLSGFHK